MMIPTAIAPDAIPTQSPIETSRRSQPLMAAFSPREREIVTFITAGCSNQEIADCLGLRIQTVKNHLCRIYRKLRVPNRVHLAVFAVGHGIGALSPSNRAPAEPDPRHSA